MHAVSQAKLVAAAVAVTSAWPQARPRLGIVLGSGWGNALDGFEEIHALSYDEIPNLGATGAPGHAGRLLHAQAGGRELFIFQGRRHLYEGADWTQVVLPIWILKQAGASCVLLTNAAGGIREDLRPGTLMALEDHINLLGGSPLVGPHVPEFGERFPDQTAIYDPELRQALFDAGADASGVYASVLGPSFETPAEIRAFRSLGADAVGMSTVPEAIFANALGLRVAGLSCICNRAAGLGETPLTSQEVLETAQATLPHLRSVLQKFTETVLCNC
jgi:purine-nucleoside phosphorylase